eukprot:CAMPEP_0119417580 /NCGR_PEP_ID=MMETSP1335-20130426/16130_1 /TAXON_ID=259385 /ORGANISM="Chrysoculter rhomboideus, Strain RCC1486" /LENGTH=156 /DNA_ID=CAMNT_0007442761 /DNA_START=146 /DNA_END=613 /DNA_ORIENTATION=-
MPSLTTIAYRSLRTITSDSEATPKARHSSAFLSDSILIVPSFTPEARPHASMTYGSLVAVHAITSTPLARSSSYLSMNEGRCDLEQPGVNAPGTAKITAVFPATSSPRGISFALAYSGCPSNRVTSGSLSPSLITARTPARLERGRLTAEMSELPE